MCVLQKWMDMELTIAMAMDHTTSSKNGLITSYRQIEIEIDGKVFSFMFTWTQRSP
jgi:hypothetical protein